MIVATTMASMMAAIIANIDDDDAHVSVDISGQRHRRQ